MATKKTAEIVDTVAEEGSELDLKALQEELKRMRAEMEAMKAAPEAAVRSDKPFAPAISEERVTVKLFRDNGRYAADMFVGVNGVGYQIKRGIPVEVPRVVAEVLAQSEAQDAATALMIEEKKTED